jgi:hypothetical protein
MASSRALVVSCELAFICGVASLLTDGQATTKKIMANESDRFLAARVQLYRPTTQIRLEWLERLQISLHVSLKSPGPGQHLDKTFGISVADSAAAQSLLSALRQTSAQVRSPECVVEIRQAGYPTKTLSWSLLAESSKQHDVRQELERISHVNYAEALAYLERGRALTNPELAGKAFEAGIQTLGDRYSNPDLLDDTDTKLALAKSARQKSDLKQSATLLERVLESRLQVYAQRFKL